MLCGLLMVYQSERCYAGIFDFLWLFDGSLEFDPCATLRMEE